MPNRVLTFFSTYELTSMRSWLSLFLLFLKQHHSDKRVTHASSFSAISSNGKINMSPTKVSMAIA